MYQQLIIVGNLGADPEMKYTQSGKAVTELRIAVNRVWTNQDGSRGEETTWFRVSCWGGLAETTNKYLSKGRQVMVVGRVSASAYMGQDGQPRASLDVTAQEVKFLQGGGSSSGDFEGGGTSGYATQEEDIPF